MNRPLAIACALILLAPALPVFADTSSPSSDTSADASSTGEVLVKFKDTRVDLDNTQGQETSAQVAAEASSTIVDQLPDDNIAVLDVADGTSTGDVIDQLSNDPNVEYAEPDYARSVQVINTNDTFKDLLWALDNTGQFVLNATGTADDDISAPEAWNLSTGTSTIVAVIDNGVLYTHPDLTANMWDGTNCVNQNGNALGGCNHGFDFAASDTSPLPDVPLGTDGTHGTHVSGIIAAAMNNGMGTIGVAPNAKIMAIKFDFDVASEVEAIDFARENGAKIMNASYGGSGFSQAEHDAIQRFENAGGIFVAAAGNGDTNNIGLDSDSDPVYPADYDLPNIVSVAATDQNDQLASFSNYGTSTVDIAAPGVNILSTATTNGTNFAYGYLSGTSMATPMVAGALALAESLYPTASSTGLINALLSSGDPLSGLSGKIASGKRLNAFSFLETLASTTATSTDTIPPVITLNGDATTTLTVGQTYTELGATATDNVDASTTVIIGGDTVNTSVAGTYHVTYDATDQAGNHAVQVIRTVIVNPAPSGGGGGGGGGGSSGGGGGGGGSTTVIPPVANPARPLLASSTAATSTPSTQPAYTFTLNLSIGSKNADVTALQNLLTRLGFYTGPITGYYGSLTSAAVIQFRMAHGLPALGVVDAATRVLLTQQEPLVPVTAVATTTPTSTAALIQYLLTELALLEAQLAALKAR